MAEKQDKTLKNQGDGDRAAKPAERAVAGKAGVVLRETGLVGKRHPTAGDPEIKR